MMKCVIADTGALISLELLGQVHLIEKLLGECKIAKAVSEELLSYQKETKAFTQEFLAFFEVRVVNIQNPNYLASVMDYGESESVILYDELGADYLLIDDYKARELAESIDVKCLGSIGLLIKGKEGGHIEALRPLFQLLQANNRFFAKPFLNAILKRVGEPFLD